MVILTAVIIAALLVTGCTGIGGSATPTPVPTPTPQAGNSPTPAPTWNPAGLPTTTGQLYDMSGLNWYGFRLDRVSNVTGSSGDYRFEFDDATYHGLPARHTRETYTDLISGTAGTPDSIIDVYASPSNGSIIGGHAKMSSAGQVTMDQDLTGSQITGMMNRGFAFVSGLDRDARLTSAGTETISLDGKPYTCTLYRYTVDGIARTAWYTPQAPAPLKVTWTFTEESQPVNMTATLTGWG